MHSHLHIVDFAGDPRAISFFGSALVSVMNEEQAEYADFWQLGFPEAPLLEAGFAPVPVDGSVFVPNYFEPFSHHPGKISCAFRAASDTRFMIMRADGDQDRPNHLPNSVQAV